MKQLPGTKKIRSSWEVDGRTYRVTYLESDDFNSLDVQKVSQAYGVCFYSSKMVIGYNGNKGTWGLLGGTIEFGESFEDALKREVLEESNCQVMNYLPVGYQIVEGEGPNVVQLRYACKVKRLGDFTKDPSGSITEVAFIEPSRYKQYFDWGEIGDAIVQRAISLEEKL